MYISLRDDALHITNKMVTILIDVLIEFFEIRQIFSLGPYFNLVPNTVNFTVSYGQFEINHRDYNDLSSIIQLQNVVFCLGMNKIHKM